MNIGRVLGWIVNVIIGSLGLLFVIASSSKKEETPFMTLTIGLILCAISTAITYVLIKRRPAVVKKVEITQHVELAGDTDIERLKCQSCGATLNSDSVIVGKDGSVFVNCQYCGSSYQITEKPKW